MSLPMPTVPSFPLLLNFVHFNGIQCGLQHFHNGANYANIRMFFNHSTSVIDTSCMTYISLIPKALYHPSNGIAIGIPILNVHKELMGASC